MEKTFEKKLLTFGYLIFNKKSDGKTSSEDLSVLLKSFLDLGFILDYSSLEVLKNASISDVKTFYFHAFSLLKASKGANVQHIYFYRNFPNMEGISDDEYVLRAMLHYLTVSENDYGYLAQDIKEIKKEKENVDLDPIVIRVISEEKGVEILAKYFTSLFEANHLISDQDQEIAKSFMKLYPGLVSPSEFLFRENLVIYTQILLKENKKVSMLFKYLPLQHFKTVTDVLRLYAAISNYSFLDRHNTFKSLDRKARKSILSYLDFLVHDKEDIMDDFVLHEVLWKKAFRLLHVGEYALEYPSIYRCAYRLRANEYVTFFSKVNAAITNNDHEVFTLLKTKPGYFARMLDSILRNTTFSVDEILKQFTAVIPFISTNVIIELWEYYQNRNQLLEQRFISYRNIGNFVSIEIPENRTCYDEVTINKIISCLENGLKERFATLPIYHNVYLDPIMKNYMVPFNNKNQSQGLNTLTFGSKIALDAEDNTVLRFFTYWKNMKTDRVDIDLSAEIYDDNYQYIASLAWHDMGAGRRFKSFHSGDITSAPKGASEFIDINLEKAKEYCRYIVVCNTVFTDQCFNEIPECFSGVMFRKELGKRGPVFDPKTVQTKFDLSANSTLTIAFIIDLKNMELIFCDLCQDKYYVAGDATLGPLIKKAVGKRMSIYDLMLLHQNHLTFVDDKEKADFIIDNSPDSMIHPSRIDEIMEWVI